MSYGITRMGYRPTYGVTEDDLYGDDVTPADLSQYEQDYIANLEEKAKKEQEKAKNMQMMVIGMGSLVGIGLLIYLLK